jgi:Mn-dependent DtxR family transcriptional regulator
MSPQEASLTPAQQVLVRLYLDTSNDRYATKSYYALCETLRIDPSARTEILRSLIAVGHVRRKSEGHICLTEAGKQTAIALLA